MASIVDLTWVERPWGKFLTVYSDPQTTVKMLMVNGGQSISLQYHEHRDEFWTMPLPHALVQFTVNGTVLTAEPGVRYHVPKKVLHRITNNSPTPVQIVEVIKGRYDEDDIIRIHDKYGREQQ